MCSSDKYPKVHHQLRWEKQIGLMVSKRTSQTRTQDCLTPKPHAESKCVTQHWVAVGGWPAVRAPATLVYPGPRGSWEPSCLVPGQGQSKADRDGWWSWDRASPSSSVCGRTRISACIWAQKGQFPSSLEGVSFLGFVNLLTGPHSLLGPKATSS